MEERRLAKFSIREDVVWKFPSFVVRILSELLVVHVEHLFSMDGLSIEAFGPEFPPVPDHQEPPHYHLHIEMGKVDLGEDALTIGPVSYVFTCNS